MTKKSENSQALSDDDLTEITGGGVDIIMKVSSIKGEWSDASQPDVVNSFDLVSPSKDIRDIEPGLAKAAPRTLKP